MADTNPWQRDVIDRILTHCGLSSRAPPSEARVPPAPPIRELTYASDILGVSGGQMIRAIIRGEQDATKLADLARRKLRSKIPQLQAARHGHVTEHHRFMPRTLMEHLHYLESAIERLSSRIGELTRGFPGRRLHDQPVLAVAPRRQRDP